jgi:Protein of unknown function (DUF1559)
MTWLEGNMNWTRYNHFLPPGAPSCKTDITWNGVAMTANSRHPGGVHLLLGDGAVRFVSENIHPSGPHWAPSLRRRPFPAIHFDLHFVENVDGPAVDGCAISYVAETRRIRCRPLME